MIGSKLVEDPRYLDRDGKSVDPPMTDYERELLSDLRKIFGRPYLVFKVPPGILPPALIAFT